MAARQRAPVPKKKASGPNIEEWQRGKQQKKFRLAAVIVRAIKERATALGVEESKYVSDLVARDVGMTSHQSGGEE